jgi:hypothetical protein
MEIGDTHFLSCDNKVDTADRRVESRGKGEVSGSERTLGADGGGEDSGRSECSTHQESGVALGG